MLVVGAGFAGIGAAIELERAGITDFMVIEKAESVGGTWRENTYPGCACDVASLLYSFSFAPNPEWSRSFAGQPEIEAYLQDVSDKFGVTDRINFGTELLEAHWEEGLQRWRVETSKGRILAQAVVAGTGPLHQPRIPDLPGLKEFKGKTFHSAEWDHAYDLTGKRVAVIGTGASAIQFVPMIQPDVENLTLFQRTAPWVLPKADRRLSERQKSLYRRLPFVMRGLRGLLYHAMELVQIAQRHPKVMRQAHRLGLKNLEKQVPDETLRRKLTPHFVLGCKRILLSNTYYPALTQPNVDVVNAGVIEVKANSVIDAEGNEHEVDTIIFGTGFHATDPPIAERVHARDGRSLAERWQSTPQAYLGSTIAGAPNLFLTIGPNLGNGHSSAIVLIEAQLRYVVDALNSMEKKGFTSFEVSPAVHDKWNADVQEALQGTVWNSGGCSSYYIDANGRNSSIYPWTTIDLRRRTKSFDLADYEIRTVTREKVAA